MFKEKLSKILIRIFYVLFAVILAVALWIYVEITENEVQIADVSNIAIEFINNDFLRDRGFFITTWTPQTLTIRFEAPRGEMARLRAAGALVAEVDVAGITTTGTHQLVYRLIYPSNVNTNVVTELGPSITRITLTVDMLLERQIQVEADYKGGLASDSLLAGTTMFDPRFITVRGPERVVSRIRHIEVPILRENLSTTLIEDFEFIVIDDAGEILDEELRALLEFSHETVRVTVPITEVKDVPLLVILHHGASTSEQNTTWRVTPETIRISGDPVAIGNFNNIVLQTIDMTNFGLSFTDQFPIIVPNHLTNESGEIIAQVYVEVIGLEIAFRITSNLQVTGVPAGHLAEIQTQSLDVRIRGQSDDLALVTPFNLRVVADLSDRNPGQQRVPARVYIDGIDADIDPVGTYFLTVNIYPDDD